MDVLVTEDLVAFAVRALPFIEKDPFSTNVVAVNVGLRQAGHIAAGNALWVTALEDETVVGIAMETPPYPVFLPRLRRDVARAIADALAASGRRPPGVTGERESVAFFTRRFEQSTGVTSRRSRSMRLYVLGSLHRPAGVPGRARRATSEDAERVFDWFVGFHREAALATPAPVRPAADQRIALGEVHLWEDGGEPSALACVSEPACGVSRVGPVYTPPERRRRGYGAAITAATTEASLASGARSVMLYTDLANPVSNSIYQAIGYEPFLDSEERVFAPSTG